MNDWCFSRSTIVFTVFPLLLVQPSWVDFFFLFLVEIIWLPMKISERRICNFLTEHQCQGHTSGICSATEAPPAGSAWVSGCAELRAGPPSVAPRGSLEKGLKQNTYSEQLNKRSNLPSAAQPFRFRNKKKERFRTSLWWRTWYPYLANVRFLNYLGAHIHNVLIPVLLDQNLQSSLKQPPTHRALVGFLYTAVLRNLC